MTIMVSRSKLLERMKIDMKRSWIHLKKKTRKPSLGREKKVRISTFTNEHLPKSLQTSQHRCCAGINKFLVLALSTSLGIDQWLLSRKDHQVNINETAVPLKLTH